MSGDQNDLISVWSMTRDDDNFIFPCQSLIWVGYVFSLWMKLFTILIDPITNRILFVHKGHIWRVGMVNKESALLITKTLKLFTKVRISQGVDIHVE